MLSGSEIALKKEGAPLEVDELDTLVAPSGGSDAVGGQVCAGVRAIILILTAMRK